MYVNERECEAAGKNPAEIRNLAREFSLLGKRARALGVFVFGGSGSGTIRCASIHGLDERPLILAGIEGNFDGGDGAIRNDAAGLERGE